MHEGTPWLIFHRRIGCYLFYFQKTWSEYTKFHKNKTCCFQIAQYGYTSKDILFQDNTTCQLLENNGHLLAAKGTHHVNIPYFFITDKIKHKEIKVAHCPMEAILADFYTKWIQGALFIKFPNLILGIKTKDFKKYKPLYKEVLKPYNLLDNYDINISKSQEYVGRQTVVAWLKKETKEYWFWLKTSRYQTKTSYSYCITAILFS